METVTMIAFGVVLTFGLFGLTPCSSASRSTADPQGVSGEGEAFKPDSDYQVREAAWQGCQLRLARLPKKLARLPSFGWQGCQGCQTR